MAATAAGLMLAAIHGYRPHTLGLCGPAEARRQELLKKFLQGQAAPAKMKKIFRQFMGAYAYYELIAKSNKIKNTFDKSVIEAYWIGNKLLDKVKTGDLRQMIAKDFAGPGLLSKKVAAEKAAQIPVGSKPHHSFHVLTIGSVTGSVDFTGNTKLKDICRVGWGCVEKFNFPPPPLKLRGGGGKLSALLLQSNEKNEVIKIIVRYQPLIGNKTIKLGQPIKKEVSWDKLIAPKIKKGDWVSFHWDWLVKVLNDRELKNLKKYTRNTLSALK